MFQSWFRLWGTGISLEEVLPVAASAPAVADVLLWELSWNAAPELSDLDFPWWPPPRPLTSAALCIVCVPPRCQVCSVEASGKVFLFVAAPLHPAVFPSWLVASGFHYIYHLKSNIWKIKSWFQMFVYVYLTKRGQCKELCKSFCFYTFLIDLYMISIIYRCCNSNTRNVTKILLELWQYFILSSMHADIFK